MATPTESTPSTITGLPVRGALPAGLSGRLVAIGPDTESDHVELHAVDLHEGRAPSHRSRWVSTDGVAISNIIVFGGSILALGDGSPAYELTPDLTGLHRVDLAGRSRGMSAYPKRDPNAGDLHVLAIDVTAAQAHVVVSSGALTRTSRHIPDAPSRLTDLAITIDHVVFVANGFVGVMTRNAEARITWIATVVDAPNLVHARDAGDTIVVHALTPSLERWTLHAATATMQREVLDPTPRRFARTSDRAVDEVPRFLWTAGDTTADKYDLVTTSCVRHVFGSRHAPGDLVFVADPSRPNDADGGWLVGFVHHASADETDLVVLDAADVHHSALAAVRIPRRIARRHHSTWIPSAQP